MTVELAQVAAGLPVAASFALAGGISTFREGRRRAMLNEALHELRRPLQVLSLALPESAHHAVPLESSLKLVTSALDRLDREINGSGLEKVTAKVSVNGLIDEAVQRWKSAAASGGSTLQREWNGPETWVEGDRFELSQALDNLLSNAVEHGAGKVKIGWRREGEWISISVSNDVSSAPVRLRRRRLGLGGRRRRGHGLRVVQRVARRHGGGFVLRPFGDGVQASLRLPSRSAVWAE